MMIQRYVTDVRGRGEYFGEHTKQATRDFTWYHRSGRIGIKWGGGLNPGAFLYGLLTANDEILILRTEKKQMARSRLTISEISDMGDPHRNVEGLIRFIQNNGEIHLFDTSDEKNGSHPNILTFSTTPPPESSYRRGHPLEVRVE